jgi:hypothetical protein
MSKAFEGRSRLISLVYEVLRHMETPPDGATDRETLLAVSRAFSDEATRLANLKAAAPDAGSGNAERRRRRLR